MPEKGKTQEQGNVQEPASSNTENMKNSQTSSGGQNFGNQSTGSAATAKKYDSQSSGNTEISSKPEDSQSPSTGGIKEFYDKAKQSAGQVTEKATDKLEEKKTVVTQGLSGIADTIRQVGETLRDTNSEENPVGEFTAKYGDALAGQVEQISNYFERKDIREIARDVEGFARRNPAIFIGGAFAVGILAARFLKSASPKHLTSGKSSRTRKNFKDNDRTKAAGSGSSGSGVTSSSSGLTSTNPS